MRRSKRGLVVVGALCLLSACGQGALETIVVAPRPIVRVDSAASAAFSTSALAVMRRVATQDSLVQFFNHTTPFGRRNTWLACFGYAGFWTNFTYCARMQDSVMRVLFRETGPGFYHSTFDSRADSIRRHVLQNLRGEFGESRVRNCGPRPNGCPRLVEIDSSSPYDEDPLVASLARVNGKKQYRHTVGNVLDVLEAMRGHRYVLALGSHMHSSEHSSFVSDGVQLRSEVSAAIVGPNELGPTIFPSGFTLYTVHDGKIDAGQFVRLDPPGTWK